MLDTEKNPINEVQCQRSSLQLGYAVGSFPNGPSNVDVSEPHLVYPKSFNVLSTLLYSVYTPRMSEQSKELDTGASKDTLEDVAVSDDLNGGSDGEEPTVATNQDNSTGTSISKKKKSTKAKLKKVFGADNNENEAESSKNSSNPASKLTPDMVEQLLEMNLSLKNEVAGMSKEKAAETIKKLDAADLLSGMVRSFLRESHGSDCLEQFIQQDAVLISKNSL